MIIQTVVFRTENAPVISVTQGHALKTVERIRHQWWKVSYGPFFVCVYGVWVFMLLLSYRLGCLVKCT